MRAIDGDALIKWLDNYYDSEKFTVGHICNMVKDMPTIKPERKTGHWEITEAYPHNVYCSNCHRIFAQTHWPVWEDGSLSRNFCSNCGSYNGGEQDE